MARAFDDEDRSARRAKQLLEQLEWFDRLVQEYETEGVMLKGFSVRMPSFDGDDYFVVIRAETEGAKMVAFLDGEDLVEVLRRMVRAVKNRKLKFREDKYE